MGRDALISMWGSRTDRDGPSPAIRLAQFWGSFVCFRQLSNTLLVPRHTKTPRLEQGGYRDAACCGHPAENNRPVDPLVALVPGPHRERGGRRSQLFVWYCLDDRILVKVQWWPGGQRCRGASASLASGHFRLFGQRPSRDPPLLSSRKDITVGHRVVRAWVGD